MKTLLLASFIFAILYTIALLVWFFIMESRRPKRRPVMFDFSDLHVKW